MVLVVLLATVGFVKAFVAFPVWVSTDPPAQAEVQALRDKAEGLADDVRALSALVHALRGALVAVGVVKGGV